MANYNDQNEPKLPLSNKEKRATADLLPRFYRTDSNKKFLQATLDQLTQPGTVKKVNGYIGRQNAKAVTASDIFLSASDTTRQNYQLEPAAVIQDYLGNVNFYKDYIDHINHIDVFGGNTTNHERLNKQEFYSWDPHVCWDKFINYQNYYWLPYGPTPIEVFGISQGFETTYTVNVVDDGDNYAFVFGTGAQTRNPTITLYRGQTYTFEITAPNNPFTIKTARVAGELEKYLEGVSASTVESGIITFTVPLDAPDVLYYVSENSVDTAGVFHVLDVTENTYLNVSNDIIGKKYYTTSNGIKLSNGMKLKFVGRIEPEQYSQDYWYVEGVGTSIKLIAEKDLEIISGYTTENSLLFDDTGFDQDPFSTATAYAGSKDYIVISRGSPDRNPWSRYNRWFHEDVIKVAAEAQGNVPELDQSARAIRPIIEFESGLKLFNFGHRAKANVDLIDTDTTDVFSTVEGALGYNVDGVDLVEGMRVLFAADTDSLVNGKIFKVNFININETTAPVEFFADRNVDVDSNRIIFDVSHKFATGNQVFYLNNDNLNISGLINRKIYYVRVIDTKTIELYNDKSLTLQVNILATGTGVHKFEVLTGIRRQINLVEEPDATPQLNETVLVKYGSLNRGTVANPVYNQGSMYWYDGTTWKLGQRKTTVNQTPYFDVFDENGVGYSNLDSYDSSTFKGTKVFSYKVGTGTADTELGFPLSYQNINNIGDISFEFNLLNDSFEYKVGTDVKVKNTDVGYLKSVTDLITFEYCNGWTKNKINKSQPIVRIFKGSELSVDTASGLVIDVPIDVYNNLNDLNDLEVKVYINGIRVNKKFLSNGKYIDTYSIVDKLSKKYVRFNTGGAKTTDIITLKLFSQQQKNANGHYEIPVNLQNNPLNNNLTNFTLGEVSDHVNTIIGNINTFEGKFPGAGNLRDAGKVSAYGTRFVQHSGPLNLSLYHFGSKTSNVFTALEKARNDYSKFKRAFIIAASTSGIDTEPAKHVDYVLAMMTKDRAKMEPYYLSDMFGYSGANRLEYTVLDSRTKTYPLSENFNLTSISNKAVYVYLNGEQLLHGKDYVFGTDIFFTILVDLTENDLIEVYEYESTDGTYCPATPTKLGLYPKFEPKKFIDDTYIEPTEVIQGHDGSITVAYGDYRDDLILELEKRIYNNIKVEYNSDMFDIYDYIPGYNRKTDYSKEEVEKVLSVFFFQWSANINQDYTIYTGWDRFNPFTFNYRGNYAPDGSDVPAYWRGIYKWLLDTDRPHTHPWECLGFSIEPTWWQEVYGPAPYTSNNFILWNDLKQGIVREPGQPIRIREKFIRPVLETCIPVDEAGELVSPLYSNMASGLIKATDEGYFVFGDQGPVESAWRKSSHYTFSLIQAALLLQPNKVLATCYDRSRIVRNLNNQIIYKPTGLRIKLEDLVVPSNASSSSRVITAGLVNYIIDYITSDVTANIAQYEADLGNLTNNIGSKLGGFSSKSKFRLMLDSKSVTSSAGVFVPEENYKLVLNTSSPIKKVIYSGVILTKYDDGFEIRGYNNEDPYFKFYPYTETDRAIRVGGISESFVKWSENKFYVAGKIVRVGDVYYRVKINHTTSDKFDDTYYTRLAELPVIGGREGIIRKSWNTNIEEVISYGTKLSTVQEVVDFLQGYGKYLEVQGFAFDEYNSTLRAITNWETSVKEFLFWTTQNWAEGSVLSMSPAATKLVFRSVNSVVNDIRDEFYTYKIFRVDGQKLEPEFTNTYRDNNEFTLVPRGTSHGIYAATLYLVQKEHALILDNRTLFNDIIYDLEPGYRQERLKVLGYISTNWTGGFDIPGFVYDSAKIADWSPWTDYNLGDIVKYKEFYYTANKFLPGVETFNNDDWILQTEKPESRMLANWDYRAEQFTDFYDLDTDNFNSEEQRLAQHLIGYQKRQYLENIIKDDVSQYKFYQGMIIEKGTQNVFNKLFDVLSADNQESLTFNEEWAVRVGNYGASAAFEEIEFNLKEDQFKVNPQAFELADHPSTESDFILHQHINDVYIKPIGYNNNPWPTTSTKKFLRTPGYVRYEDVKINVDKLADVVGLDINNFVEGDYVWCAFESRDWNVYRLTPTDFRIDNAEYADGVLTLECNNIPEINAGDVIGIKNSELIAGFHVISSVSLTNITINIEISNWETFADSTEILSYKFVTQRAITPAGVNIIIPKNIKVNELVWVDNAENNQWAVYQHSPVFSKATISALSSIGEFGTNVALSNDGNLAAIAGNNEVTIFEKSLDSNTWTPVGTISTEGALDVNYGIDIEFSNTSEWLAVAAESTNLAQPGFIDIFQKSGSSTYYITQTITALVPGEKFGSVVKFAKLTTTVANNTAEEDILIVSSTLADLTSGKIYFYKYNAIIASWEPFGIPVTGINNQFGHDISVSLAGDILAISAPGENKVYVYKFLNGEYNYFGTISNFQDPLEEFGNSISVAQSGNLLVVNGVKDGAGIVYVYNINSTGISLSQTITNVFDESIRQHGTFVSLFNNDNSLVIGSTSTSTDLTSTATTVDVYDWYNDAFVYGESIVVDDSGISGEDYRNTIAAGGDTILVGAHLVRAAYSYVRLTGTTSWTILHQGSDRPNTNKIKKAYLYDTVSNTLLTYLDIVDPIQGKIPGPADQEIRYKTYFDPAVYTTGDTTVVVDEGASWTTNHVGLLWWDLTRAKFLENQGDNIVYRSTTWNTLYETASIDIYEWVQSVYLPSEWDELADTEEGLALGISGTSKYGDSVYSVKRRYDTISRTFSNTYFYWVKNKTIVPNLNGRTLSAKDVSTLISDPIAAGYTCIALTGSNSFSLVNCEQFINDTKTNLNVQYWIIDNQEMNNHSQWRVISEHPNTTIPSNIEDKWLHSLAGRDDFNRLVPDLNLPFKIRYGIENRPRQGMFVNRVEALKQYFERVNSVLINKLIVDEVDLTDLEQSDPQPTKNSGIWDAVIDTESELRFVGTASLRTASLSPVVENGRIVQVNILDSGNGYVNAPVIKIVGVGTGATLQASLNALGQISSVEVINGGDGYLPDTMLSVRSFSVLVQSDSTTFNKWSIYSWNKIKSSWDKIKGQAYDVTKFWQYIDWYYSDSTEEYNQFTKIDHLVENTYQLVTLNAAVGEVVKVKNVGTGGWLLLHKFANNITIDYTENYKVIGRQNGTIKFLDTLYTFKNSVLGFDGSLFDAAIYDDTAATELKIILNTIKNKIFIDDLRVEYLKLFFASLRYAMHEQTSLDWAFKTSFIKATHNAGSLKQKVSYNSDNLENFEDYVNEVKPYRSKVREYISAYSNLETAQSSITDFDIIPIVDSALKINPVNVRVTDDGIIESSENITSYPWKHWLDNVGFTIQSIEIVDGGSGYINNPVVKIDGGFGTGAVAKAYISSGRVTRIQLVTPGTGYLKAPIVTIEGGLSTTGVAARAVAIIESEVVRANKISIKFDRLSKTYFIRELTETETFTGTGSRLQFPLTWSPNAITGKSTVTINGSDVLRTDYMLTTKKSTAKGYTSYTGLITFETAPAKGDAIVVTYEKDFNHMAATDRINFFYDPATGQLGKDLAQLMTGVDYGGVNISGLGFNLSGGWDSLPWFTDAWDGFDAQFDDYIVIAQDSTYSYTLPYVPAAGELINIYVNGVRVDDPYYGAYDGVITQPNGRKVAPEQAIMNTFVGDGLTDTIVLPLDKIDINDNDKIIFRKSTSDGSYMSQPEEYDTQLSGGSLVATNGIYTTATGYEPDDINVDGDGFVTPTTSHAPEEVVPGQLSDAVSIKVFHRPTSGAPVFMFKNYVADGVTNTFVIGQQIPSGRSVFVKVDELVLETSEYTLDYPTNSVVLNSVPTDSSIVSVISLGFNAENVLDLDYFVADGSTTEFVTRAPWLESNVDSTVLVNGTVLTYELFRTDESYDAPGLVGIRFGAPPAVNAVISFVIDINTNSNNSYSTATVAKSQTIVFDGSTQTYELTNLTADMLPGTGLSPYETNVLVRNGQEFLKPSMVTYYTLENNNLVYNIPTFKYAQFGVAESEIRLAVNGNTLVRGRDYVLDMSAMTVTIDDTVYVNNGKLAFVVDVGADYLITDEGTITFTNSYTQGTQFEIITFYNHKLLDVERTTDLITSASVLTPNTRDYFEFTGKSAGRFVLRAPAISDDYVWVIKNGAMLTSSVDYYLDEDHITINLADSLVDTDVVQVMAFSNYVTRKTFGFMQFKDMLNRVHFKRISRSKTTRLARDLIQTDTEIYVVDGSVLSMPNPAKNLPGIVEINGERIEYFTKNGNVLGQLRRGTLGTGTPILHRVGLLVIDFGPSETIPYMDQQIVDTLISNEQNLYHLGYTPTMSTTNWSEAERGNIPVAYGRSDELDVFVGGYNIVGWETDTSYSIGDIVLHGAYTYKCVNAHTSKNFNDDVENWKFFIGNIHLKKIPYKVYNVDNAPDSTDGDVQFNADFSVDGTNKAVRLTNDLPPNTKVVVVKKIGKLWNDPGQSLVESDNQIANFLKSEETVWPQFLSDKYQYVLSTDELYTVETDDNNPLELD